MRQLTGVDNLYISLQYGNQATHFAGLGIYDPSTAPGATVRYEQILAYFAGRLDMARLFRHRLIRTPFDLDRPYWFEAPRVDLEFHIRHIALPQPGNWQQLCTQVARIHSRPLDLTRPAWEAYLIEGLDQIAGIPAGSFALYLKAHHSAMDGEAAVALLDALHMNAPSAAPVAPAAVRVFDGERDPSSAELLARAVSNHLEQARDASKLALDIGPALFKMARQKIDRIKEAEPVDADDPRPAAIRAPYTRFSGDLSPHRVFDAVPLTLEDIKRVRKAYPETTVNDVFMTVCAGAVRRYLEAKQELPHATLNALIPISYRTSEGADVGGANRIALIPMPLRTDIAEDDERLFALHRSTQRGKTGSKALGLDLETRLIQMLPARVAEIAVRKLMLPMINLTVSNVRGPAAPIYLAGAKCLAFVPISVPLNGMGLNITGFSYAGVLWMGTVADRVMMPDPEFFSDCLRQSFAALMASARETAAANAEAQTQKTRTGGPGSGPAAAKPDAPRTRRRARPIAADSAATGARSKAPEKSAPRKSAPRAARTR